MTPTCGREDCDSPCHRPHVEPGRYCAPARCYCGGCPAHEPLETGPGRHRMATWWAEALRINEEWDRAHAHLVPIDQAPAELGQARGDLHELTELEVGPARHRAVHARASRSS